MDSGEALRFCCIRDANAYQNYKNQIAVQNLLIKHSQITRYLISVE